MEIRFLLPAQAELDDAFAWYENQAPGLGYDFLDEVDRAVHRIKRCPESSVVLAEGVRRVQLRRFPYGLIYGLQPDLRVVRWPLPPYMVGQSDRLCRLALKR